VTHLLDTSAVLAHLLDEPGAEEVEEILLRGRGDVALAAPVWAELHGRLGQLIPDETERGRIFRHYSETTCLFIPVDEAAVLAAVRIRQSCPGRLPLMDALIAGCAAAHGLVLVHRDRHMDGIPASELSMLRLPDKLRG